MLTLDLVLALLALLGAGAVIVAGLALLSELVVSARLRRQEEREEQERACQHLQNTRKGA